MEYVLTKKALQKEKQLQFIFYLCYKCILNYKIYIYFYITGHFPQLKVFEFFIEVSIVCR